MIHELKCWPIQFEAVLRGAKTFEARRDDRGFGVGDTLQLREFDPATETYSGRSVSRLVTYLLRGPGFGIERGFVVLALGTRMPK